jgi:uncharacterized protein (TIGR03067 family)
MRNVNAQWPMLKVLICVVFIVGLVITPAIAQDRDALALLQGRWVVTSGEHNGKPLDAIKGGVLTISGDSFEIRTASGNLLKGTLRVDISKQPSHMDFLHADGTRWNAIYEVSGEAFRLNYVEAGNDPRPAAFTTSDKTEETIVSLRREAR